jgi:NADH-quinone oxidoreductase subunit H
MDWMNLLIILIEAIVMVLIVMCVAGYSVVGERKVASWVQLRPGPNRTTVFFIAAIPVLGRILQRWGIIQLPADGLKFLVKEEMIPGHVNKLYYNLAPVVAFVPAMVVLAVIPFGQFVKDGVMIPVALSSMDVGILFVMAVSGISVFGLIMAGWAANSKFPYFGSVRASAQLISYELTIGLSLLPVFLWTGGSLDLFAVVREQGSVLGGDMFGLPRWFIFFQPVSALLYLIAIFAECNRLPFDMPESETDLVGGFHTEYSAFKFGLFFVGEYAHMTVGSLLFSLVFLGGWSIPFCSLDIYPAGWLGAVLSICVLAAKAIGIIFLFMLVRWTLPRFRYDQVMNLGWKILLPVAVANFALYAIILAFVEHA